MGFFSKKKIRMARRAKRTRFVDNFFSKELAKQGEDGKHMRLLYLNPWTRIYEVRVIDESLRD